MTTSATKIQTRTDRLISVCQSDQSESPVTIAVCPLSCSATSGRPLAGRQNIAAIRPQNSTFVHEFYYGLLLRLFNREVWAAGTFDSWIEANHLELQ